jgi:hypothetical protein
MLGSDDTKKTPTVDGPPANPSPEIAPPPSASAPPPPQAPSWSPRRHEGSRTGPLIGGTIVLLIGLWFFATTTLGLDLPRIDWRQSWPVILIVIGLLVIFRSFARGR